MAFVSMRRMAGAAAVLGAVALWGTAPMARDEPGVPNARDLLARTGFSSREIADIERDVAVARILDTDSRQIAVIGAVKVRGSVDPLARRFRSVEYLKGGSAVRASGVFGRLPSASDVNGLPFEEYDLDVRDCRPGSCRVRLSAADIAMFQREVKWGAPDWMTQSESVWRKVLSGYAAAFVASGAPALPVFVNKEQPLAVQDERALLVSEMEVMRLYAPELYAALKERPANRAEGFESLSYWAVEDFGIRPVMRVVHQTIASPARAGIPLAMATSQVYAAHYLDAAVGFTCAVDGRGNDGRSFYLVSMNRARTRSLSGFLRSMVRSTVRGRSRDAMVEILTSTKRSLEGR